jgi:hypothetical protein
LVAPESLSKNSILFIGINFADGGIKKNLIDGYKEEEKKDIVWYVKHEKYVEHEKEKGYPYYKKFSELVDENQWMANENWTHLDLFFFIATKQAEVYNFLKEKVGKKWVERKDGKKFMQDQLELSKNLIILAKPKLIVVANALASRIFKGKYNGIGPLFECKFDKKIGTHRIKEKETLKDVPVFFTSMLSGQRALDKGSFERLKWHIPFVLNHLQQSCSIKCE